MMENCSRRRIKGYANEDGFDRLSELPDPILSKILSNLPTEDFYRATLLSQRLKSLWSPVRILDVDYNRFVDSYDDGSNTMEKKVERFTGFVERMLALHQGQQLEELRLALDIFRNAFGRVDTLVRNWVRGCTSFVSLKTLHVTEVRLSDGLIEDWLVKCPVLENLHLENCWVRAELKLDASKSKLKVLVMEFCRDLTEDDMLYIQVFAPGLLKFKFVGGIPASFDMHGEDLIEVELRFPNFIFDSDYLSYFVVIRLIKLISNVHTVKVCDSFLKMISIGSFENIVPTPLRNLNHLSLSTCWGDTELEDFAGFLMFSPYLETLSIKRIPPFLSIGEGGDFWESLVFPTERLHHHLKTIELKCFSGQSNQMKFLSYMLKNVLVLDKVVIEMDATKLLQDDREKSIEKLLAFEKASPNVQFIFS